MLSNTSRKDVAKDKASDLASAVADAAEAGRERVAPVLENVTGHLSDAADKASDAAKPHLAKAKDAVTESAKPHVAKTKAKDAVADATDKASDAAKPHVAKTKAKAKDAVADATDKASDAAKPHVAKTKAKAKDAVTDAKDTVTDAAAPRVKKAKKAAEKAAEQVSEDAAKVKANTADRAEAAGLTAEQAQRLFADEWMPRIQETIAATSAAGNQAYAALPKRARDAVETVAPQVAKKRRKKGTVLIALGLLAGAGAIALYLSGRQKGGSTFAPEAPEIERLDVSAVEKTTASPASDDAVGDLEKKVDSSVSGSRRGRHAAEE